MWNPKEKEIPIEEALEEVKRNIQYDWYGSAPLFTLIQKKIIPLSQNFYEKNWIFCLFDPSDPFFEKYLDVLKNWYHRYSVHQLFFLSLLVMPYPYLSQKEILEKLEHQLLEFSPFFIDRKNEMISLFHPSLIFPFFMLVHQGETLFDTHQMTFFEFELMIQQYLRNYDKGLPFSVPRTDLKFQSKSHSIEFGEKSIFEKKIRESGEKYQESLRSYGEWKRLDQVLESEAVGARIECLLPASKAVYLIAGSKMVQTIEIQLNEAPVHEQWAGKNLTMEADGKSYLKVLDTHTYCILENVKIDSIKLIFILKQPVPTSFFSLRFS